MPSGRHPPGTVFRTVNCQDGSARADPQMVCKRCHRGAPVWPRAFAGERRHRGDEGVESGFVSARREFARGVTKIDRLWSDDRRAVHVGCGPHGGRARERGRAGDGQGGGTRGFRAAPVRRRVRAAGTGIQTSVTTRCATGGPGRRDAPAPMWTADRTTPPTASFPLSTGCAANAARHAAMRAIGADRRPAGACRRGHHETTTPEKSLRQITRRSV